MILFLLAKIYFLGPFQLGIRDIYHDFLFPFGEENYKISLNDSFFTPLAKKGYIKWKEIKIDSQGYINIEFDQEEIEREYSYHGWSFIPVSYIYIDTFLEEGYYLAFPERIYRFYIDSLPFSGNPYGYKDFPIPFYLKEGKHRILLVTGAQGGKVRLKLSKIEGKPFIYENTRWNLIPDIIKDSLYKFYCGIFILNPTDKTYKNLKIKGFGNKIEVKEAKIELLLPFSGRYIPIIGEIKEKFKKEEKVKLTLILEGENFRNSVNFELDVKTKDEPLKITFLSKIDSTVQYFGLRYPKKRGNYKKGVIFTLHGASVEAYGQVKAYRQKDSLFIVAPTNRRPYGFDWQDLGLKDLWEVIDFVKKNFTVDTDRFYLTGHSMGGHGTFFNAIYFADRFAAASPSAGWISFRTYVPFYLQNLNLLGKPEIIKLRERIFYSEDIQKFVRNALNLPFLMVHGEEDQSVPVFHSRFMLNLLRRNGIKAYLWEVENQKHWWNLKETEGVDCIDADTIINFLKDKKRISNPDSFEFHFSDLSINNRFYNIEIIEPKKYFYPGFIKYKRKNNTIEIKTKNVECFKIRFDKLHKKLILDENEFKLRKKEIIFLKSKNKWKIIKKFKRKLPSKNPSNSGLIKNILNNKILLIYSTSQVKGNYPLLNYKFANNLFFYLFFKGNKDAIILPDTLFKLKMCASNNVIFIGNPNSFKGEAEKIIKTLPLKLFEKREILADILIFVYPSYPFSSKNMNLYIFYRKKEALYNIFKINLFTTGTGLPDGIFIKDTKELLKSGSSAIGMFLWNKNYKGFDEIAFP